jgi:ABC-type lipoprotein release transport system permease subunit
MHDLKFALRQLRRSPGFTFVAVLTLALGIGANVAIFSVVNTVLLHPFAFSQPDRLVWISAQLPTNPRAPFSLPEFCDYRDQNTVFNGLAAVGSYNANLVDSGEPERVQGVRLSANIFGILQMIMSEGFRLVATGMVLGILAAIPFANLIATQLYGVSTHDPLTYAIVLVALSTAALFASYFAARRAMHLDPMVALRHD